MLFFLLFLGFLQGLTEFLPVSSSGHLALFQNMPFFQLYTDQIGRAGMFSYDILLHFATLLSILFYFARDILQLIQGFLQYLVGKRNQDSRLAFRLALLILLANIPVFIIGLFLKDYVESAFEALLPIGIFFIVNGLFLFSTAFAPKREIKMHDMGWFRALVIGLFQAIAVLPGISRSGSTIGASFYLGIQPSDAARFSFLLGLPPIAGAALLEAMKVAQKGFVIPYAFEMIMGMVVAFITGLAALRLLVWLVSRTILYPFGIYTFLLGLGVIVYTFIQ